LALFKLDELRFSGHGDALAALVLCGAHRGDRVMVASNWVVIDGAIPGLNVADLIRSHSAAARAMRAGSVRSHGEERAVAAVSSRNNTFQ
jgi:8-oxoguanine deaminase